MFEKITPLKTEDHTAALYTCNTHTPYKSPLESPMIPWATVPVAYVTDNSPQHYFQGKEAFLVIANLISSTLGRPTAVCVLSGTLAGAANWEGVSIEQQYRAVTESAGVFEASAMTYLRLTGPDAENVLNMLTPRDMRQLKPGRAMFILCTTPFGTVDNEAVVLRLSEHEFLVSCCAGKPLSWLYHAMNVFPKVVVSLAETISFNIKGPKRVEAMQALLHVSDRNTVETLPVFHWCQAKFLDGNPVWLVKTKIGLEMWGTLEVISHAWKHMLNQPALYVPCGWDMLHVYRMECQDILFTLYPLDIHDDTTLWEIGCGWMTSMKNRDYIGEDALMKKENQKRFTLKKIKALDPSSNAAKVGTMLSKDNGDFAGYVTSSAFSIRAERAVAFAHLTRECMHEDPLFVSSTHEVWHVDAQAPVP